MAYRSIFADSQKLGQVLGGKNNPYAGDFTPGQYASINAEQPQAPAPPVVRAQPGQATGFWQRLAQVGAAKVAHFNLLQRAENLGKGLGEGLVNSATALPNKVNKNVIQPIVHPQKSLVSGSQLMKLQNQVQGLAKQGKVSGGTMKLLSQVDNPQAKIKAYQMITSGSKDNQVQQFLKTQQKAQTEKIKSTIGAGLDTTSLVVGGGEAKGLIKGGEAVASNAGKVKTVLKGLKSLPKKTAPIGGAGAAGNVGSMLQANPNASGKELAKSAATGYAGGAALGVGERVISKVASGTVGKLLSRYKSTNPVKAALSSDLQDMAKRGKINPELKQTPVSNLKLGSDTLGAKLEARTVSQYKADIKAGKPIAPLVVSHDSNGTIFVQDGAHRLQAMKELGVKHAPVVEQMAARVESPSLTMKLTRPGRVNRTPSKVSLESGSLNVGKISEDVSKAKQTIQSHLEQNRKATSFSGDIARDAQVHNASVSQRLNDSAKLLKSLGNISKEDKQAVWNYREAKAAGTELPKLTADQQALHESINQITKDTNAAKAKLVDLKAPGYTKDKIFDPESGNHRIALGHGTGLEQFLKGNTKSPLSARSLRTSTASSKARVYYAVTDENGNRSVAAIKNVSVKQGLSKVSKGKFVNAIDDKGNVTRLGKVTPQEVKNGSFIGKDGKEYKISQATTNEITKATGQQYIKDPLTSALVDYHETKNALESAQMLNKWKTSSDFENIALKHGEGTPPKGWKTTRLPQMQGYSFEPKVAEVLDDIYGNIRDKVQAVSLVNHAMRNMMVAIPIRHNLNEIGFYFTDRGLTSLINPVSWKRGTAAIVQSVNEVMNQGPLYREMVSKGFNFMDKNDQAFADQVTQQTKSLLFDEQNSAEKLASDAGTTVTKFRQAWSAIQHKGVWFQQDVLNMARVIERQKQGMSLEQAVAQTERFNPQYRVPSRVLGSRAASQVLRNNNLLFFGSYHYDQWKALTNIVKDAVGRSGGRAAFEAYDKLAALTLGVYVTHALIDKGLQQLSGNPNATTKPFGVLDLPDQLYQVVTGKKDISSAIQSQLFPSFGLSTFAQLFENRDFFTGKQIRDPNLPRDQQVKQIGQWIESQLPTTQQITNAKKGGSLTAEALSLAGVRFPKNAPSTNQLYSLKYDTLPNIQSQAKKQAQAGDIAGAQQTIKQYDTLVLNTAKQALKDSGKPVPSDNILIKELIKKQYYYSPHESTIRKWQSERPTSIVNQL